jgi:hypothetical protein
LPSAFDSVTDDAAMTVGALRRERLNCAFKTIENVFLAVRFDAE